jgi:hypothetical protein
VVRGVPCSDTNTETSPHQPSTTLVGEMLGESIGLEFSRVLYSRVQEESVNDFGGWGLVGGGGLVKVVPLSCALTNPDELCLQRLWWVGAGAWFREAGRAVHGV